MRNYFLLLLVLCAPIVGHTVETAAAFRVFVSTDLGGDPDDIQSLIHLLHYSDILQLEGIISTCGPGSKPKAENINYWIKRTDLNHLRANGFPELIREENALAMVKQGMPDPSAPGPGKSTDGSRSLIQRAHADDPQGLGRPLWVLVWGAMTDLAQALHDDPGIADKIRVYSIGSSNTEADPASRDYVYEGLKDKWPILWWIENGVMPKRSRDTFRGYYEGGDQSGEWGNREFIKRNIRGHGTGHASNTGQKLGDEFPLAPMKNGILKEGDTPSFTYLLSSAVGGVGDVDDPTAPNWGGRFYRPMPDRFPGYYTDLDASAKECRDTISRWRKEVLRDWKRRWDRYGQ